jgi:hypothetical protein
MFKKLLFFGLSIVLSIVAVIFQRLTGPDEDYKIKTSINGIKYSFKFPKTQEGETKDEGCLIQIVIPADSGFVYYKHYDIKEIWTRNKMNHNFNENLICVLPYQKPLIQLEYYFELFVKNKRHFICKENPMIVRFQRSVPKTVTYPYVVLLFISFIFSIFSALMSISFFDSHKKYFSFSFYVLSTGMIFGILNYLLSARHIFVRLSPYNDLTFYKSFIVYAVFAWTFLANRKRPNKLYPIIAGAMMIIFYFLPQDLFF